MSTKKTIIVANWKMYMPYNQLIRYCQANGHELDDLGKKVTLICCPSTTALSSITQLLQETSVQVGAQNCSEFREGAYTGQESAQSLADIGCSYCIIGHSECRSLLNESNDAVGKKLTRLLQAGIQPIICIGETQQEYLSHTTFDVLRNQLDPIFATLVNHNPYTPIAIAYEPVWAIGTGLAPSNEYLTTVFSWIAQQCSANIPTNYYYMLYGGSVNENNVKQLQSVRGIDGFLIGGASLDFQNFKKIVSLL